MFLFTPNFAGLRNLVSFMVSSLRLTNHLLIRSLSLASSDASFDLFLCGCHCGFPGCFIIRYCGGDVDRIADPIVVCLPSDFIFSLRLHVDRGIYSGVGVYYFIVILAISPCRLYRSSKPTHSLSVPSLLGGSAMEVYGFFSTNRAAQCQVGPYARFTFSFDWSNCFCRLCS